MGQPLEPAQSSVAEPPPMITGCEYLDDDPDTSLVTSLRLHLISEHAIGEAITKPEGGLDRLHRQLHLAGEQTHVQNDFRFRPGRVMRSLDVPTMRRPDADVAP